MKTGKFSGCLFFFLFITIGRGRVSEKKTAQLWAVSFYLIAKKNRET